MSRVLPKDDNNHIIPSFDSLITKKTVTFDGSAGNGAQGTVDLFNVTGLVAMRVFGVCTEDLAGASATIEVGVAGAGLTNDFISSLTATAIDNGDVLTSSQQDVIALLTTSSVILNNESNVIATIGTADITAGTIEYYAIWRPISEDGNVEAA